ncbi:vesicle-associated membrane protein/synaptobrevin-binding protein-like [Pollicipes pollicipes]|uniref:vesicle-associated membrane protein/synaptobrevin-binding protein-like n=1 Tax=Pollicipes pollicipes TaxID=41117 RepID=UPI001884E0E7|nr:vesicle-associated membrane protein/synaptobrevin-binding protein-like [Pollicipes pollicipes]
MTASSDSFLVIEPAQLRFKGPFKDEVSSSSLKITNHSDKAITFKIKTTAPKRYCVRPNQGILNPGASTNIAVMLQPFTYDPAEKNKHKFMVQTMFLPEGEHSDLETLWKNASPEQVMTSNKMRCVFEQPADVPEESPLRPPEPGDIKKVTEEVKHLREEISSVMSENQQLMEEATRLRRQLASGDVASVAPLPPTTAPADPMMYYVLALVLLCCGVLIGRVVM